jgi:ketosteroid isomerase-like protein
MSTATAAELARGWIEAWIRLDLDWLRAHLAPDFIHVSPLGTFGGREAYLAAVVPMARKSVVELVMRDVVADGDRAVIRFVNRTPRGPVETCDWVRVANGRIQEIRSFYDSARIREVLAPDDQVRREGPG